LDVGVVSEHLYAVEVVVDQVLAPLDRVLDLGAFFSCGGVVLGIRGISVGLPEIGVGVRGRVVVRFLSILGHEVVGRIIVVR
jgi:hypothetical protein